ncbi:MAG: hypothetical protein AAF739_12095 [Pseudomonadota bacterium]
MLWGAKSFVSLALALLILALPGGALAVASESGASDALVYESAAAGDSMVTLEACCEPQQRIDARGSASVCSGDCPMLAPQPEEPKLAAMMGGRSTGQMSAAEFRVKQRLRPPRP